MLQIQMLIFTGNDAPRKLLSKADTILLINKAKGQLANVAPTVIPEQGLSWTLIVWAGGFCAAPAVVANTTVGAAVTLTPCSRVAPIYTPLPPQEHRRLNVWDHHAAFSIIRS